MADKPIIFSAPMVQALLFGRKTQTRRGLRVPKWAVDVDEIGDDGYTLWCVSRESGCIAPALPQYLPGDRLWVREAHKLIDRHCDYRADWAEHDQPRFRWRPSIHMPRWASRITLTVTDVRVQRLQEISEADARAEGGPPSHPSIDRVSREFGYPDFSRSWFAQIWNSLHGPDAWPANPWVVALTFTVERRNIDEAAPCAS